MSLDVTLSAVRTTEVYSSNITHNLIRMAEAAGIYEHIWYPDKIGVTHARHLILPLTDGLALMKANPGRFKAFDSPNGWGMYRNFVPWVEQYLAACIENPDAEVEVSR